MSMTDIVDNSSSYSSPFDPECAFTINSTDENLLGTFYVDYNRRIVTIGIPIVVTLGLLGNMSFLFVICRLKHMRNMTNFYLANLAVADILVLFSASIQYFWSYAYSAPLDVALIGYTFKTPFGCSLPNLLNYSCYFASIWFITLVAGERYLAICHPLKHRIIRGKGRAFRLVFCAWLLSFSMGALAAQYAGIDVICVDGPSGGPLGDMPRKISRCTALCPLCETILWVIDTFQFFIALVCNTAMYGIIIYTLSERTMVSEENGRLSQEATRVRNQENRDNVARMLSINALLFFFCLSPFMILNLDAIFGNVLDVSLKQGFNWFAKIAYLLNSTVDPYIFSGVNRRYRQAFYQAFGFQKKVHTRYMSCTSRTTSMRSTTRSNVASV